MYINVYHRYIYIETYKGQCSLLPRTGLRTLGGDPDCPKALLRLLRRLALSRFHQTALTAG